MDSEKQAGSDTIIFRILRFEKKTQKQCKDFHQALTTRILPRMKYHHMFPQSIAFGPEHYGGIGLYSIDGEQAVAKITYVMMHIRANTSIGEELIMTLRWAQVNAGTQHLILQDTRPIPHLEGKYVRHLRECLHYLNAKLYITELQEPSTYREHDSYIMDHFMESKEVAAEEHEELNFCRLYLNVKTIAHMATTDGKSKRREMLFPDEIVQQPPFPYPKEEWPRQQRPYKRTWKKWYVALTKTICTSEGVLYTPLGKWTEIEERWTVLSDGDNVYQKVQEKWTIHPITKITRTQQKIQMRPTGITTRPKGTPVTDKVQYRDEWKCTVNKGEVRRINNKPEQNTWADYCSMVKWIHCIFNLTAGLE